jgi:hypothetical protein
MKRFASLIFAFAALAACEPNPVAPSPERALAAFGSAALPAGGLSRQVREIRAATARFHSVRQVEKAGYIPASPCVSVPGLGGMGIHYVNPVLLDGTFDPLHPEALLYEPGPQGQMRLVAVEYLVMGGQPDPLLGAAFTPGHVADWELHVWVWAENPLGTFAPFNPNVSCG